MTLDLERPLLLLLLPVCLGLVYLLWRTSRAYMPPVRRRVSLGLRVAVTTLLVLVLANPLVQLRASELAVAFLLDRSDSLSPSLKAEQERWLARALAAKGPLDEAAVITFGQDASVERALDREAQPPRLSPDANVRPSRTDIAAAIHAGVAALPPNSARRLVLLSDGRQNLNRADTAAALAAAAGVQIQSVSLADPNRGPEVLLRGMDAPTQVREGERFATTIQVDATVPTFATLNVLVDGSLAARQEVDLTEGTNRFVLNLEALPAGHHYLRAHVEAEVDTLYQNNAGGALTIVSGPASVLVVEGTPGEGQFLVDALRTSGLNVDVGSPTTAPLELAGLRGYATVVLSNVPAGAFGPGQLRALKSYVQSFGGGLVVTGGEQTFGPGGYARTTLEEMLPVRMDLRGKALSASTALLLVIDTSGSMGGGPGGASKMDLAKEAAIAAAELLGEYDQIGIVAFEDQPRWIIQPTLASDLGVIQAAIAEMAPGGGTEIFPALRTAYEGLAPVDAKVKHIILLTDGQAPQGNYPDLTQRMRDANISLSTIAIGADADFNLLQNLATMGGGRYYEGNDPFDLPRLVVKETQQVQRAAIVEEEFRPIRVSSGTALEGIAVEQMPMLRGYVATTPKPQSTTLLVSRQIDPILSEWQFGLGRVVSWTSDTRNRWAAEWLQWPDYARFWAQVVKRASRPPEDPNRQVSVRMEGNQARITLDAQAGVDAEDRHYLNFQSTSATIVGPQGAPLEVAMPQTAPGRYEALVPVQDDGQYLLEVTQQDPQAGGAVHQSSGFVVPYSPEYRGGGLDEGLLESIARRTGGGLIREPEQVFSHDLPAVGAPRPLWPQLLVLAALLYVGDVGVRRIRVTGPELRGAYLAVRRRLGYVDDPEPGRGPARGRARAATAPVAATSLVGSGPSTIVPIIPPASAETTRTNRLLAAKQRAARR